MKRSTFILILFICLGFFSRAQLKTEPSQLISYYDYEQCYTGLKGLQGNIVHPAIFSNVRFDYFGRNNSRIPFWTVTANGKTGIISNSGEYVVPMNYDDVRLLEDSIYITYLGEKSGIYDLTRDTVIAPYYEFIQFKSEDRYIKVNLDNKHGVLDLDYNELLATKYDYINKVVNTEDIDSEYDHYFYVGLDHKRGLVGSDGTVIIPIEYRAFTKKKYTSICKKDYSHFLVFDENKRAGYMDWQGNILVPLIYKDGFIFIREGENCTGITQKVALMRNEDGYILYDLLNNKKSQTYLHLAHLEGDFIYTTKNGTGVLNEDFEPVLEFESGMLGRNSEEYMDFQRNIKYTKSVRHYNHDGYKRKLDYLYHVLANPKSEQDKTKDYKLNRSIVLLDSQKQTGYHSRVAAFRSEEDTSYWAIDFNEAKPKKLSKNEANTPWNVKVYNANMDIVFDKNILRCMHKVLPDLSTNAWVRKASYFVLENEHFKFGWVSKAGEIVVPFLYDHYQSLGLQNPDKISTSILFHVFGNENGTGLTNDLGQTVLPYRFDTIGRIDQNIFAIKGDSTFHYDVKMNLLNVEVLDRSVLPSPQPIVLEVFEQPENRTTTYLEPYYYSKNNFLYYMAHDSVASKVDNNFLKFNYPVRSVDGQYLISNTGKILLHSIHYLIKGINGYFINDNKQMTYYNFKHEKLTKVKKGWIEGQDDQYKVIRNSDYSGLFDTKKNVWLFEMKYFFINRQKSEDGKLTGFWVAHTNKTVKDRQNFNRFAAWQLVDVSGKPIIPYLLNSRYSHTRKTQIINSGEKFGLMTNLELDIPPIYDHISRQDTSFFLYKDKKWSIYTNGTLTSETYDAVSNIHYPNGYVVFKDNKTSILNNKLETILPFVDTETALTKDLKGLLKLTPKFIEDKTGIDQTKTFDAVDSVMLSYSILRLAYQVSSKDMFASTFEVKQKDDFKIYVLYARSNHIKREVTAEILHKEGKYISEKVTSMRYVFNARTRGSHIAVISYETHKIEDGKIEHVTLKEFIVQGKEEALDSLIIAEINRTQAFGAHCVDLMGEVEAIKLSFTLGRFGLHFHDVSSTVSTFEIPYYLLEGIIKID